MKQGLIACAVLIASLSTAEAGVRKICNTITKQCWLEDERGNVVKPHRHVTAKPKRRQPEVRGYVRRDTERDDRIACKDVVTVIGDARPSEQGAREDAESVFMRTVRYRYGESWMSVDNARDYASRCARASITEIVGAVMVRCELKARPCRAPFQTR